MFTLTKTNKSPEVIITENTLNITGVSLPENSLEFYLPIIEEIKSQLKKYPSTFELVFLLEYFNTSSAAMILKIIKLLFEYEEKINSKEYKVVWKYTESDEDMLEAGKDFAHIVPEIHFEHVAV